jgi:DNA topoisomerase-3
LRALRLLKPGVDEKRRHFAFDDRKITAHHAIIPTGIEPKSLSDDEKKIFDLVCLAYCRLFMPDHVYLDMRATFVVEQEMFLLREKKIMETGWKTPEKEEKAPSWADLKKGDKAKVEKAVVEEKKTEPPKHFTDGTLIEAMSKIHLVIDDDEAKKVLKENAGIGTEATRAGIIENLVRRGFLERKGKVLRATPSGKALIEELPEDIKSPVLTARFESALSDVAHGKMKSDVFLKSVESFVKHVVSA